MNNQQQNQKPDPLDPYQSYRFKDQNSPISETNLIREKQIIQEKMESLGRSHPILIAILIITFISLIGAAISLFYGWLKFF
ncbi:MAG: hypothetical protein WCK98_05560 [bacterium]